MNKILCGEKEGDRKVILTKMALICHTLISLVYLIACTVTSTQVPTDFMMWASLGYGAISGGSFWANVSEHKIKQSVTARVQE